MVVIYSDLPFDGAFTLTPTLSLKGEGDLNAS